MRSHLRRWIVATTAVSLFSLTCLAQNYGDRTKARARDTFTTNKDKDIVATAQAETDLSTLVTAIQTAELADTLRSADQLTVFAPTNAAFNRLPAGMLDRLLRDPAKLRAVLKYHVVSGKVTAADASRLSTARTLLGEPVAIDATKGVRIGEARVTRADIHCRNGIIHTIDTVLMPEDDILDRVAAAGDCETFCRIVKTAALADTLRDAGPYTVLVPTDAAFAKVPTETLNRWMKDPSKLRAILRYHMIPGHKQAHEVAKLKQIRTVLGQLLTVDATRGVKINDARTTKTDVATRNGVIHVIDTVLIPAADLIDMARKDRDCRTFLVAVERADMMDTFRTAGPHTLFIPTDVAFARLPDGELDRLLADVPRLKKVLMRHLIKGKLMAANLRQPDQTRHMGRDYRLVYDEATGLKINNANVIKTDMEAANGVIHTIDAVLIER